MLREVCNCGASITADDPHTITQSRVEDWRANHRHDVSQIETSGYEYTVDDDALLSLIEQQRRAASTEHAEPLPSMDAETFTLMYRTGDEHSWADEFAWLLRNHGPRLADLLEDVKDAQGFRESIKVGRDGRVWDGHHRVLVAHLAHLMVEVEVAEEPDPTQTSPADPGYYAFAHADPCSDDACRGECEQADAQAPAGEEHGAPEPHVGTPVWWEGEWWIKPRKGTWYRLTTRPESAHACPYWSSMPGAVPALTPEQQRGGYLDGHKDGFKAGRNAAARDVEALMRWRGVWVDADDAVRAARGQA